MQNLPNAGGPFGLPALLCMSSELAALKFQLAMVKFKLALERHYAADQPRAPLGTPIGGQWIGPGGYRVDATPSQKPVWVAQSGPGSPIILPEQDPLAADNRIFRIVPNLLSGRQIDETDPQWAYTSVEAEAAVNQVRQREPGWQPTPGLYADTQGAIADNIAIRQEAEARLRYQDGVRMGHNGPPEDPFDPGTIFYDNIDPETPSDTVRSFADLPDTGGLPARATGEGTLAIANINGRLVYGVNSTARGYTSYDRAAADAMREQLLRKQPRLLNTDNTGRKPNDAIYHAEANVLLRMARALGGSLRGQKITIHVDRDFCQSCDKVFPKIALELGDPEVTIVDPSGIYGTTQGGAWK